MKILLVQPSQENVYEIKMSPAYPSLGLLYIAAVLEKMNHEIEIGARSKSGKDSRRNASGA